MPRKYGRPSGRQNAESGQPPPSPITWIAFMKIASTSGRSSRSTLMLTNSSFITLRGRRVLEALVRHDVAPVARRVADRDEDRLVEALGLGERLLAPRPPLDRDCRRAAAGTASSRSRGGSACADLTVSCEGARYARCGDRRAVPQRERAAATRTACASSSRSAAHRYRARVQMSPKSHVAVQLPSTDGFELALRWTDRAVAGSRTLAFDDTLSRRDQ